MNDLTYFTINRQELTSRILVDEISRTNSTEIQRRNFVEKNNVFQK